MLSNASTRMQYESKKKNIRESNIELLRVCCMLGVILLHYNNKTIGGGLEYVQRETMNYWILLFLEALCIGAVDIFMFITGYFMCTTQKRSFSKIIELLFQVSIFRVAQYFLVVLKGESFSLYSLFGAFLPINYFVVLYIAVYVISPYVNLVINKISEKQMKHFVIILFCLFSVWPTFVDILEVVTGPKNGLSTISAYGSDYGYTIVNFMLMYILGGWIRILNIKLKKRDSGIIFLICTVAIVLIAHFFDSGVVWSYCNPLVIVNAVMLFLFFKELRFNSTFINKLAKGAFTCFLFHPVFLQRKHIQQAVQKNTRYMILDILLISIEIYIICYFIDLIYKKITNLAFLILDEKVGYWEI